MRLTLIVRAPLCFVRSRHLAGPKTRMPQPKRCCLGGTARAPRLASHSCRVITSSCILGRWSFWRTSVLHLRHTCHSRRRSDRSIVRNFAGTSRQRLRIFFHSSCTKIFFQPLATPLWCGWKKVCRETGFACLQNLRRPILAAASKIVPPHTSFSKRLKQNSFTRKALS